jgi:hypothetical protein
MNTSLQQWPALVVTSGPRTGQSFTIAGGRVTLGRDADADITLDSHSVSRHHAAVHRDGDQVVVEDLGSTNGTYLNADRLTGPARLAVGDTLRLGDVELQFGVIGMPERRHGEGPVSSYDFGDVHGPVNAGSGAMNVGSGQQYVAGRDFHYGDTYDVEVSNDYDPSDEMFQGKGPGRALAVLGSVIALVGFVIWIGLIFSSFGVDDPSGPTPFDRRLAGVPALAVGFGLFVLGGVLSGIGTSMSKAARKRQQQKARQAERRRTR